MRSCMIERWSPAGVAPVQYMWTPFSRYALRLRHPCQMARNVVDRHGAFEKLKSLYTQRGIIAMSESNKNDAKCLQGLFSFEEL